MLSHECALPSLFLWHGGFVCSTQYSSKEQCEADTVLFLHPFAGQCWCYSKCIDWCDGWRGMCLAGTGEGTTLWNALFIWAVSLQGACISSLRWCFWDHRLFWWDIQQRHLNGMQSIINGQCLSVCKMYRSLQYSHFLLTLIEIKIRGKKINECRFKNQACFQAGALHSIKLNSNQKTCCFLWWWKRVHC